MKTQNLALGFGVVVIGVIAGAFGGSMFSDEVAVDYRKVNQMINEAVGELKLGANPGPDSGFDYWGVGGVREHRAALPLRSGSTTVCTITAPTATSTLAFASLNLRTGTATAVAVDIVKGGGAGQTASSTSRFTTASYVLAANTVTSIVASSTGLGAALDTFNPRQTLNFIMNNGSGAGQLAPTGECRATFIEH